jgi:hypothetical protein
MWMNWNPTYPASLLTLHLWRYRQCLRKCFFALGCRDNMLVHTFETWTETQHIQHHCWHYTHDATGSVYAQASSPLVVETTCWCTLSKLVVTTHIVHTSLSIKFSFQRSPYCAYEFRQTGRSSLMYAIINIHNIWSRFVEPLCIVSGSLLATLLTGLHLVFCNCRYKKGFLQEISLAMFQTCEIKISQQ